jgi:parallel beta-helix repeat protein
LAKNLYTRSQFFLILLVFSLICLNYSPLKSQECQSIKEILENKKLSSPNLVGHEPIVIVGNENFISQASNENWSGSGTQSNPYIIEGLNITGPGINKPAIEIWNTNIYFCIRNSFFKDGGSGIAFNDVTNGQIVNNTITNTFGGNNERSGIHFYYSNYNLVANNTLFNHEFTIQFEANCSNNIIHNNNIYENINGILSNGDNNVFSNNSIYQNDLALAIGNSKNNLISGNSIFNNGYGISVGGSGQNMIINSVIYNCFDTGIGIDNSDHNIISNNSIFNCNINGIILYYAHYNEISKNIFSDHVNEGLYLEVSNHNRIFRNGFFGYVNTKDGGTNNTFMFNYWNIWTEPDVDQDGIVDNPYSIGMENQDLYPLTSLSTTIPHFISSPTIIFPNGGEIINGTVVIRWIESFNICRHPINYSIHFSTNNGEKWVLISTNLQERSYSWDTSLLSNGPEYVIKITAFCCEEEESCSISKDKFVVMNQEGTSDSLFQMMVISTSAVLGCLGIAYFLYQTKQKLPTSFVEFFETEQIYNLKTFYHKVIIGLENISTAMITEKKTVPVRKPIEPKALSVEFFPLYMKEDLQEGLKGRTVLTLIEIAYQGPDETNPVKLANTLNIPSSTLSNEIKRLIDLNYLETYVSLQAVKDARYRNYKLTPKGVEFLYILKDALELSIRRLKERSNSSPL